MPTIIVRIPEGVFDADARKALGQALTQVARTVEQIGDEPRHAMTTWVILDEIKPGNWFAAGQNPLATIIPAAVFWHYPEGVLDAADHPEAARLIQEAVAAVAPGGRRVITSVAMTQVDDGTWSAAGAIWRLPDFARAAGFKHLQHLVPATEAA